jgi:hypothetical protein
VLDYSIVICSHNRADTLATHTLSMLQRFNAPLDKTTIFVAENEIGVYRARLWETGWNRTGVRVLEGAPGLGPNRNVAMGHHLPGTRVLSLDDDVKDIRQMLGGKWSPMGIEEFNRMIESGFALLPAWNGGLWGVCNIMNDLWARRMPMIQIGMPIVQGPLCGFISPGVQVWDDGEFEDVERVCRVWESGRYVIKLNEYAHWQSHSRKGGLQGSSARACEKTRQMEHRFPKLVEHTTGREPGKAPCRPWPRKGMWVNDPVSIEQVDALRRKVEKEPPRIVSTTIHDG